MALLFQKKAPLYIEMVPKTAWGKNLRTSCLAAKKLVTCNWDRLRKLAYQQAGNRCEVCSGRGNKWPVECHEVWDYRISQVGDEVTAKQRLDRLSALCPACHEVKHMGFARTRGREREAMAHLATVNGWTWERVNEHVVETNELFLERSKYVWTLDLGGLLDYGVTEKDALALAAIINKSESNTEFEYTDPEFTNERTW
jgi:hypothetical protein